MSSRWLISVYDDGRDADVTREMEGTKEQAEAAAHELFDNHLSDSCRDYDSPKDVPVVVVYEIASSFGVEMAEKYFKRREDDKKYYKEQREREEREQYERLQKKFGK
jgi:hypothetical protein